ncbi:MAG TPA: CusA/CzcA family heavy metal efflux RND transporter [Hyphomonas sp.]|uniref:CzcA family heavy metal efflux pump n=1 Tax=Hyphomonas polymorpha PS728 TaxID=1280954 RepID=A0A062VCJ9_9PROT|nr:CusA/CzcA family heavy metal efflux RND transporter [Hyphomonas polymorpha]KCZ97998.1 CzcA family heavy metal efflux pump [Hyphomonas polymorpha PS728]HAY05057.1 CusA/CzcA family heavy metal efflux RND transporter [Hyphomonas sp.]HRI99503.1 CusA/CzcA family heavy metal efflux RND transporter [Hyphomonas sp.]HRK65917.1 CusA/CzcA family heavy metal efflux RND transporter [Hyphomonas sp.]
MFKSLIEASVQFRWFVVLITLMVAGFGLSELLRLPIDAVPDITNRQVQINTVAPALAPEQMERQVTFPLETAMAGIPGLESTRSLTRNGFSQVTVIFTDQTDIYFARQQVSERMTQARESLPEGVEPALSPITTGLGEVLMWTVDFEKEAGRKLAEPGQPGWQSDGAYLTPEGDRLATELDRATYLRTVQDWIITPRMRTAKGLAGVDVNGGYVKEYAVQPDAARLASYGLSFAELVQALERANTQSGAGFIQRAGEALTVRSNALAYTTEDLAQAPVANRNGLVIRVADVATVAVGQAPRLGAASHDGHEAVVGTALMIAGGNSRTVAQAAAQKLEEVGASLPPGIVAEPVLDRSVLVNSTISTVAKNLTEGALLVIAVLFLLLGNIRAATITALMIPISFLFAVIGMNKFGISGNLMSLGALDFGLLVDGAVVVVENTLLMLGQKRVELGRTLKARERLEVAGAAARKMIKPAAFGQIIILLVFTPLLMLEGVEGKTFIPMGATVMLALVGAFIFSFTFVPAMTALMVREPKNVHINAQGEAEEHETFLIRIARRGIVPVIRQTVDRPVTVFVAAIAALAVGATAFMSLGREFIPTLDEGDIAMQALRVPSTSLEQSKIMQTALERAILEMPEVETVFARTGTAEAAIDPMPPNISDAVIKLKDRKEWPDPKLPKEELIERIDKAASQQLGNAYEFSQPIELRFNELISGVRTDLAVLVYGDDFAQLQRSADQVAAVLRSINGSADVRVEQASGMPTLTISVDRFAAANFGLSAADVSEVVSIAVGGGEAGQIFEGDRRFDVMVRLSENDRNDPAVLASLPIVTASGVVVPLSSVANIQVAEGQNQISRNNGSRRMVVQSNVRGRDLGGFVTEAQAKVAEAVTLPAGYSIQWGGQFENLKRAEQRLSVVTPAVFVMIGVLLFMALGSFREAGLVFACVPLALVGGALALWLRGMPFSVSAAVGFIAVSGVATLNGLVLMQAIRERLQEGQSPMEAALEGASSRLRAVLTTAMVAIVGFIPMAIAHGAGAEVQKPLATVVIGGLITATLLTLIVLPTFASRTMRYRSEGLEE